MPCYLTAAQIKANRELDRKLRSGAYCQACARPFGPRRPKSTTHRDTCAECAASLD